MIPPVVYVLGALLVAGALGWGVHEIRADAYASGKADCQALQAKAIADARKNWEAEAAKANAAQDDEIRKLDALEPDTKADDDARADPDADRLCLDADSVRRLRGR
jgi:hypothetical protein